MVMFITLEEASVHVRRDTTDDNLDLTAKIKAASNMVLHYLNHGDPYTPELDSFGEPILDSDGQIVYELDVYGKMVPLPEVKEATKVIVDFLYNREYSGQDWKPGYLPETAKSLLYGLRTFAIG